MPTTKTIFVPLFQQSLAFLRQNQQSNGSFASYSFQSLHEKKSQILYQTTFANSLILSALESLDKNSSQTTICSGLSKYLLSQKSKEWSFNYWGRHSPQYKDLPYPDDLDDTFCALAALYAHNSELLDGESLGKVAQLLIATEQKPGGPYKTWLTNSSELVWQDIDLAVNSNIAYFLSLQDIELPALRNFQNEAIEKSVMNLVITHQCTQYYILFPAVIRVPKVKS